MRRSGRRTAREAFVVLAGAALLLAACGTGEGVLAPVATSSPPSSTTVSTTASTTVGPAGVLVGRVIEAQWIDEGHTQVYLEDGRPVGLTSGTRIPVEWSGDYVSTWLGFADWSGVGGARARYERDWDGEVLLLEETDPVSGLERFTVLDHVGVFVPGGTGLVSAACFDGVVPRVAQLRFSPTGPQVVGLWRIDLDAQRFEPVPTSECPWPPADPAVTGGVGSVSTVTQWWIDESPPPGQHLDLSTAVPQVLPYHTWIGLMVDGAGPGDDIGLAVEVDSSVDPPVVRLRLSSFLGWDYGGLPLWRAADTVDVPSVGPDLSDPSVTVLCSTVDGRTAAAVVEGPPSDPRPIEAWAVDRDRLTLEPVDPSTVACEPEYGD